MDGLLLILGYLGIVITAITALKGLGKFIANSNGATIRPVNNPVNFRTMLSLIKHLWKEEAIIVVFFVSTSAGLIAKYFSGWTSPPGSFLEGVNLLCIINFWIHFKTTNLGSDAV